MNSSVPFLLIPFLSTFIFAGIERFMLHYDLTITKKDLIGISLEAVRITFSVLISFWLMREIIRLFVPFEIFSLSNLAVPNYIKFITSFLVIDFINYLSHRAYHGIQPLWKIHRLHHSDIAVDSITSLIHHPLEFVSIFLISFSVYVLFDVPIFVINIYTLILVIHSPFTHTRIVLPRKINRRLSYLIITPNFHRLHHSIDMKEGNSNFGAILPFWDKILGTYKCKTQVYGTEKIRFGIDERQSPRSISLKEFLINPFR